MKYRIVSPLVGTPGEIYDPAVIVNFGALVAGGFIVPIDNEPTPADEKPAKTKSKKTDQE
jgi:hypothetical protein